MRACTYEWFYQLPKLDVLIAIKLPILVVCWCPPIWVFLNDSQHAFGSGIVHPQNRCNHIPSPTYWARHPIVFSTPDLLGPDQPPARRPKAGCQENRAPKKGPTLERIPSVWLWCPTVPHDDFGINLEITLPGHCMLAVGWMSSNVPYRSIHKGQTCNITVQFLGPTQKNSWCGTRLSAKSQGLSLSAPWKSVMLPYIYILYLYFPFLDEPKICFVDWIPTNTKNTNTYTYLL